MPSDSFSVAIASSFMIHRKGFVHRTRGVQMFYVDCVFAHEPVADPVFRRPKGAWLCGGRRQDAFELAPLGRKSVHEGWRDRQPIASGQRLDLAGVAK